ncbi:MAG: Ig-like domain-containing protein [Treponema sp.]|nr:Ig-like domain-containing protein [Treponema sp.]
MSLRENGSMGRIWLVLMGLALILAPIALTSCPSRSEDRHVPVTGVTIYIDGSPAMGATSLIIGDYVELAAVISPSHPSNSRVTWSVDPVYDDVVSLQGNINENTIRVRAGNVAGTARVRVTTADGGRYDEIEITVIDPHVPGVVSVTIYGPDARDIGIGEAYAIYLEAIVEVEEGADVEDFPVTWRFIVLPPDPPVLTLDQATGLVTGLSEGGPVYIVARAGGFDSEMIAVTVVDEMTGEDCEHPCADPCECDPCECDPGHVCEHPCGDNCECDPCECEPGYICEYPCGDNCECAPCECGDDGDDPVGDLYARLQGPARNLNVVRLGANVILDMQNLASNLENALAHFDTGADNRGEVFVHMDAEQLVAFVTNFAGLGSHDSLYRGWSPIRILPGGTLGVHALDVLHITGRLGPASIIPATGAGQMGVRSGTEWLGRIDDNNDLPQYFELAIPLTAAHIAAGVDIRHNLHGWVDSEELDYTFADFIFSIDDIVVVRPSIYEISLDQIGQYSFDTLEQGYTQNALQPLSVTITNMGNQPTGELTVALSTANAGSFRLARGGTEAIPGGSLTIPSLGTAGATADFTVVPVLGLQEGVFAARVTVSAAAAEIADLYFDVQVGVVSVLPDPQDVTVTQVSPALGTRILAGATVQFTATVYPSDAPSGVTWAVTGHEAASIAYGLLNTTGVAPGTALTITATAVAGDDPRESDTASVFVVVPLQSTIANFISVANGFTLPGAIAGAAIVEGVSVSGSPFRGGDGGAAWFSADGEYLSLRQTGRTQNHHGININTGPSGLNLGVADSVAITGRVFSNEGAVSTWANVNLFTSAMVGIPGSVSDTSIQGQTGWRDFTVNWTVGDPVPAEVRLAINEQNEGSTNTIIIDGITITQADPLVNTDALAGAITAANLLRGNTVIAAAATEVLIGTWWVTQLVYDDFLAAIGMAQAALTAAASQEAVDAAYAALGIAHGAFYTARAQGTLDPVETARNELLEVLVQARLRVEANYTAASWVNFAQALAAAETAFADATTVEALDAARNNLSGTMALLVRVGDRAFTLTFADFSNPISTALEIDMVVGENRTIVVDGLDNVRWYRGAIRIVAGADGATLHLNTVVGWPGRHLITVRADREGRTYSRLIAITATVNP